MEAADTAAIEKAKCEEASTNYGAVQAYATGWPNFFVSEPFAFVFVCYNAIALYLCCAIPLCYARRTPFCLPRTAPMHCDIPRLDGHTLYIR